MKNLDELLEICDAADTFWDGTRKIWRSFDHLIGFAEKLPPPTVRALITELKDARKEIGK